MHKLSWKSVLSGATALVLLLAATLFGIEAYRNTQRDAGLGRVRELELRVAACLDEHLSPMGAQRVADLLDGVPSLVGFRVDNTEAERLAMRVVGNKCPSLFGELFSLKDSAVTAPTGSSTFWQSALSASSRVGAVRKASAAAAAESVAKRAADARELGISRELERRGDQSWLTR